MAKAVREEWNVKLDEFSQCNVVLDNNKISINHADPVKLGKFSNKGNILERHYAIPLGSQNAVLYIGSQNDGRPVLTLNGIDQATGQPYEPVKIPGWIWVFNVLYIINFIMLVGGALGGATWTACAYLSARIATGKNQSTAVKVLVCVGLYIGTSIIGLVLALALAPMRA